MKNTYVFEEKYADQVLKCSSCGFCRAVCPVFGLSKRPAYNARGKMLILKEVMDGSVDLNDELVETLFQCTTCARCANQCPSGVNPPEIIKQARKDMVHRGTCHPAFEGMNRVLQKHTNIYGEDEPEDFEREPDQKADIVFFIGCVGAYREDEATLATLSILDHLKVNYTLINEVCCSGALEDVGFHINPKLSRHNVDHILATGCHTVITGCPYCSRTFNDKPEYRALKDAGIRVIHLSQFLKDFDLGVQTDKRVTYHDPCDLGRHRGIYDEPREIIKRFAPDFVEMRHNRADALCCGAGGGVRGAFAKNSIAMARKRLAEAEEIGAAVVLTECNSCVHNLNNAKRRAQKFKIYTTPRFLNELMEHSA